MKKLSQTALGVLLGSTTILVAPAALAQTPAEPADEIVVRGARIPDEKRATSEISSLLDEASFQRTGDSDIGAALRRVTGLSLSQGKFAIVRGLNERYSSVTLDGSPLPSPEPLRRVIPLDIVPTSILAGSLVQKTYSPQFSAEFGGGLIELRTKAIPEDDYFDISLGVALDTATTAENGLTHDGGSRDWLGFDDGTRNIPLPLAQAFFVTNGLGAIDSATQEAIDTSLDSTRTTVAFENIIPPNWNVNLGLGGSRNLTDSIRVGANFAFGIGNEYQTREGRREQGFANSAAAAPSQAFDVLPGDFPISAQAFDFISTTQTASANALATFGVEIGSDHKITSTSLFLRSTIKDTRISEGLDGDQTDVQIQQENFEFFERQVWQTQLRGDHDFPGLADLSLAWRAAYGRAFRDAPYQRQILRSRDTPTGDFLFLLGNNSLGSLGVGSLGLTFSDVEDENFDAGADFVLPIQLFGDQSDVKFGYAYTDKERDTLVREFVYDAGTSFSFPDELLAVRNDVLFSPGVAGTDALNLEFVGNPIALDNARSTLQVHAAYVGVDVPLGPYVRIAAGGRYETSEQTTTAFATAFPTIVSSTEIDEDYLLPAATLTWNPIGDLQVRAGYSQTITRPQFRELTPATFLDDETDQQIIGNPFLINTEIDNYDARVEYYFSRGQFVTLGGFYKDITRPIEVTQTEIGGNTAQTFINAPSAILYGFEFEFERNYPLENVFGTRFASKDLVFKANYTWSQSDVSADGTVISSVVNTATGATPVVIPGAGAVVDGRSLQGQSNHLFNLQLGTQDLDKNERITLLVNWASSRIRQTEDLSRGLPAVIERPPVSVDFVFSRDIETYLGGVWQLGFQVRNILGEDYDATQLFNDGTVSEFDTYRFGRTLSLSVKKSL